MKVRYALLAVAALLTPALAATTDCNDRFANVPALSAARLTGSLTVGYDSNYTGRGIVISHAVAEGDSSEFVALKLNYDVSKEKLWSFDSTIAYKMVSSGHILYGKAPYPAVNAKKAMFEQLHGLPEGAAGRSTWPNIENEFDVVTAARYTAKKGSFSIGHKFVHGGLLGAMAKHFRHEGASVVNEAFVAATYSPAAWVEFNMAVDYSFQGIQGWWYEPSVTFKAPIIGPKENIKMAGLLTFGMSATSDYFEQRYGACANGAQAWWIKLATPYFATDNLIITPSVSFNWLGNGALKANKVAALKAALDDASLVPFRNFGVVAGVSCTYKF